MNLDGLDSSETTAVDQEKRQRGFSGQMRLFTTTDFEGGMGLGEDGGGMVLIRTTKKGSHKELEGKD